MHHTAGILTIDDLVVVWVEPSQLLNECLKAFFLQSPLHGLTGLVVDGGDIVNAVAYGVDIHHTATREQGVVVRLKLLLQQFQHLLLIERCAVIVLDAQCAHKVVLHFFHLCLRGTGCADAQFLEYLSRVCIDDGDAKMLGNVQTDGSLPDGGGSCYYDERFIRKP